MFIFLTPSVMCTNKFYIYFKIQELNKTLIATKLKV